MIRALKKVRLSLAMLGLLVAAIALAISLWMTAPMAYSHIDSLDFSLDSSSILVSRLDRFGPYQSLPNVSNSQNQAQTLCWKNANNGSNESVTRGPNSHRYCLSRKLALNPINDQIAVGYMSVNSTFHVQIIGTEISHQARACTLAFTNEGDGLFFTGFTETGLVRPILFRIDLTSGHVEETNIPGTNIGPDFFVGQSKLCIVHHNSYFSVWNSPEKLTTTNQQLEPISQTKGAKTFVAARDYHGYSAFCRDNEIFEIGLGCITKWQGPNNVSTLVSGDEYKLLERLKMSRNHKYLGAFDRDQVLVFDSVSNSQIAKIPHARPSAIAISNDGTKLAVGDFNWNVTMYDLSAGKQIWRARTPGLYRTNITDWLKGATIFGIVLAFVIFRKIGKASKTTT